MIPQDLKQAIDKIIAYMADEKNEYDNLVAEHKGDTAIVEGHIWNDVKVLQAYSKAKYENYIFESDIKNGKFESTLEYDYLIDKSLSRSGQEEWFLTITISEENEERAGEEIETYYYDTREEAEHDIDEARQTTDYSWSEI